MNSVPIRTESDYQAALERINKLWGSPLGSTEGDELDRLLERVSAYEDRHHAIKPPDGGSLGV